MTAAAAGAAGSASTAEHAAAMLRSQIAEGRLRPGTWLREEQVSAAFAISRNTVREAFRLLSHERLVDHIPAPGRARPPDQPGRRPRHVPHPAPGRAARPGRRIAGDPAVLRRVAGGGRRRRRRRRRNDWDVLGTADIEFHRALMSACSSPHLSTMFEQLLAELRLAFLLLPDHRALHGPYLAKNRRLLELVEAGDEAAAFADLDDHLTCSELDVLRSIEA